MTHPSRVVVVGASAAGLAVAETLRREGFDGTVSLIGAERHAPYDRPPLSKQILAGTWLAERARLRDDQALADLGLDLRLGVRAVAADPERRLVSLDDGARVGYDELVIATGVRARRLPGTDGVAGVHTLRELDDALALRDALDARRRLVVVGAGFLGAEAAAVAAQAGADVTLVSDLDAPLADVVGAELGELLLRTHAEHGVRVIREAMVDGVMAESGRVRGVRLAGGRSLAADAVLVAIGSVPATGWLTGSGIPVGDGTDGSGVVCDAFCRAGPHVWAAGDVASWWHTGLGERMRIEHRTNAGEQGMAVARNILADRPVPYTPVPYIWSDQYDLKIQIYGSPRGCDRVAVMEGSVEDRKLVAMYAKDGVVRAAAGVNSARSLRAARAHLVTPTRWDTIVPSVPAEQGEQI